MLQLKFMDYFGREGFKNHSISLRGQAGSDVPESAKSGGTLVQHASDIAEYINDAISGPTIIIGHSLGGLVVQK